MYDKYETLRDLVNKIIIQTEILKEYNMKVRQNLYKKMEKETERN